jgi:hypothetical protein
MYRDKTIVECETYGYTSNNWSHQNSNRIFKEKFGSYTRKTFSRYTKKTAVLAPSHTVQKVLQSVI